jgi:hypothetical protein
MRSLRLKELGLPALGLCTIPRADHETADADLKDVVGAYDLSANGIERC